MPVTLDATSGAATANSFTTIAEADAYLLGQLFADADWEDADIDTKNRALITATRLIVSAVSEWTGWVSSPTQALPFPRTGAYNRSGYYLLTGVPQDLKDATAEYARQLINLKKMPDTPQDTAGIKSLSAGPIDVTFDEAYKPSTGIPDSVMAKISYLTPYSSRFSAPVVRM